MRLSLLLTASALSLALGCAAAQEGEADTQAEAVDVARADEAEVMLVKGQKRERTLLETPDSVIVFDEEAVKASTFTEFTDLFRFAPNVGQVDSGEGIFTIRGVNALGGIGFAGVANSSALYVDGVFQSNLGIEGGPAALFDIEQVEIYRGPQTTLQGRNALFGAVVVNTQDPTYEWDAKGRFEYSEFDTFRYSGAAGGPIIADKLAFRVAADYRTTDGFITNEVTGRDDIDADEAVNVRAKILADPIEDLTILAAYTFAQGDASTGFGTGVVQGPNFFDRTVSVDNPTLQNITTHSGIVTIDYRLNQAITITSETAYSDSAETSGPRFDTDDFPINGFLDVGTDSEEILTTDVRVNYVAHGLDLLVGGYFFDRDRAFDRDLSGRFVAVPGVVETDLQILQGGAIDTRNFAFYADGSYEVVERFSFLFGARYDRERFEIEQSNMTSFYPEFPDFGIVGDPGSVLSADTTFDAFLPKLGLEYALAGDQRLAFIAQRGYRPGGAGVTLGGAPFEFDPEFLWNYELSYRSLWFADRLAVNANLFLTDWNDQQIVIGENLEAVTDNAGSSRLFGFEGEVRYAPIDTLSLFATVGYNNTEIRELSGDVPNADQLIGNEFPQAPDVQVSFGAVYRHPIGVFASVDGSYTGAAFSDVENFSDPMIEDNRLDDFTVFNAKIGYERDHWAIYGFVRNAFDKEFAFRIDRDDFRSGGVGSASLGAPRVFGLELTFDL